MNDITGEVNGFVEACKTNWWKYEDKMVWQTVLMNRGMGLGASQWQEVVALSMEEPAQSHVTVVCPRAWIKLMRKKIMVETMYGGYDSSINNRNLIALLSSILIGVWGLNDYNLFLSCDYNLSLEFCQSVYILNRGSWILIPKLVDPVFFLFLISLLSISWFTFQMYCRLGRSLFLLWQDCLSLRFSFWLQLSMPLSYLFWCLWQRQVASWLFSSPV